MDIILATKSSTPIIGQLATILGWIMNGIFTVLEKIGIPNLGLSIIIFSIIIYLLMTPLQIKQQKFSKLSNIMQPEIQKIQAKYKNKKDQESMTKMQEETQAVYAKYGVSPTGSCLQLIIQMPILFALYQVIYKIPAYVGAVKSALTAAVDQIIAVPGFTDIINNFIKDNKVSRVSLALEDGVAKSNSVVDFLYALSPSQWTKLEKVSEFSGFKDILKSTASSMSKMQNFFGLNIADQPLSYIKAIFTGGSIILGIVAILIPLLAWLTQTLNIKLMPQPQQQDDNSTMASSMKTMNMTMPLISAVFCFTFPVGLGIYWVASAAVRSVQQFVINKHLDKIDIDDLINENMKKMEQKRAKEGLPPQKITNQAHQSVKNLDRINSNDSDSRSKKMEEAYEKAKTANPTSIAARANMVRDYNERNKK